MAAHRYWRLYFTTSTNGTNGDIWLDEVEFQDRFGKKLSTGGVPSASSEYSGSYPVAQAFDDTLNTYGWSSAQGAFPAWIAYDHGYAVDVKQVKINLPEQASAYDELPILGDIQVQWSDNGSTWKTIRLSATLGSVVIGGVVLLTLEEEHCYWRALFTDVSGGVSASNSLWVEELTFFNASAVDVSVGGTPIESGHYSTYTAAQAFDKTITTDGGWAGPRNTNPVWIGYQTSDPVNVSRVDIAITDNAAVVDQRPVTGAVYIQWSDDGTAWTDMTIIGQSQGYVQGQVTTLSVVYPVNTSDTTTPFLLPKMGSGNTATFTNGAFTVTKDGSPWVDGGADTFDATTGLQLIAAGTEPPQYPSNSGWTMIGGTSYVGPDGGVSFSLQLAGSLGVEAGVYSGWVNAGIFALEIELGATPDYPAYLRFGFNTGYDNGSPRTTTTRTFTIGSNSYELKTFSCSYGAKDAFTNGETQVTVTVVPYLRSQNLAGANPSEMLGSGDDFDIRVLLSRGCTVYIQWGKGTVDQVQDWIIADLVESLGFTSAPHSRVFPRATKPSVRLMTSRFNMPVGGQNFTGYGAPPNSKLMLQVLARKNAYILTNSSLGKIEGLVTIENIPAARRVRLYDKYNGQYLAETFSGNDGKFYFENLDPFREYFAVAFDHTRMYNAVISDMLVP
jgi:hypothetical protein